MYLEPCQTSKIDFFLQVAPLTCRGNSHRAFVKLITQEFFSSEKLQEKFYRFRLHIIKTYSLVSRKYKISRTISICKNI